MLLREFPNATAVYVAGQALTGQKLQEEPIQFLTAKRDLRNVSIHARAPVMGPSRTNVRQTHDKRSARSWTRCLVTINGVFLRCRVAVRTVHLTMQSY